jgi:hypothetical protein
VKLLTLIYCNDGNYGKALAQTLRKPDNLVGLRDASVFVGEPEHCETVIVMDDVAELYRGRIKAFYPAQFKELRPEPIKQENPYVAAAEIAKEIIQPKRRRGRPRKVA